MNPLSYYERSKEPWSIDEMKGVRNDYENDLLNIADIGDKYKRTPGCIASIIKKMGLIIDYKKARGYLEYKTSPLYNEICSQSGKERAERKIMNEEKMKLYEESSDIKPTVVTKTWGGLDASKYPVRIGKPWHDEELIKLLKSIQKKTPVHEIAKEHDRTIGGIRSRLRKLAADYYFNDKRPIEEIQKFTGLTKLEVENVIKRHQTNRTIKSYQTNHVVDNPSKTNELSIEDSSKDKPKTSESIESSSEDTPSMKDVVLLLKNIQNKLDYLLDKVV